MKRRRAHILQGNKASQRPHHVIFFDTETSPVPISTTEHRHVLKLGWACYHRPKEPGKDRQDQWFYFDKPSQFWEFVSARCTSNRRVYLVAHNVGFDVRVVEGFAYLKANGWKESFSYDKGLTTILRYTRSGNSLEILSTTNFFGMKLKSLGNLVGLKKKDVTFEQASQSELSDYCKRDVEIILRAWTLWIDFLDTHDLGTFRRTISSQAFAAYRHRFMHTPIVIHGNMEVCRFEREAYRGGRTECFRVGYFPTEQYYYVDVNGMYAHQMYSQAFPHKLVGHTKSLPKRALQNKLRNFSVIARVTINTELPAFVMKHDDRNVYPVGIFETVLTTPDLKYAFENNMVENVGEVAWYSQERIFKSYVHYFTNLKEKYERGGDTPFRNIAKLYVNALYGKFGQTTDKPKQPTIPEVKANFVKSLLSRILRGIRGVKVERRVIDMGVINNATGEWIKPPNFEGSRTRTKTTEESYNSFPAIVAHVTAYARNYLWLLILKAGRENTFYCDTDSLIVNQQGLENLQSLVHPTKAGYLKIEKQGTNLCIHAPKDYVIGDRVRQKGIRSNAEELSRGEYRQDQFLGLAGARRRENPDLVTIKKVVKHLRREIKTGVVEKDGWITPFRFPL